LSVLLKNVFSQAIKLLTRNVGDVVTKDKDICHWRKYFFRLILEGDKICRCSTLEVFTRHQINKNHSLQNFLHCYMSIVCSWALSEEKSISFIVRPSVRIHQRVSIEQLPLKFYIGNTRKHFKNL